MNASVDSVFPEKYRILSGSALKMIAIITMLIDHTGAVLLSMYPPAQKVLFTLLGREYSVYLIFRDIGRVAFPIFCFLLFCSFHSFYRFPSQNVNSAILNCFFAFSLPCLLAFFL